MRLNLSGFRALLFLPLLLLLFPLLLHLLLPQGGAEMLRKLGDEVLVGGGQGKQLRRKQRTPGSAARGATGLNRSG